MIGIELSELNFNFYDIFSKTLVIAKYDTKH